jgi:hypothetical protein
MGFVHLRGKPMNKISEYEQHAEDCRELARSAGTPAHRERLLKTAQTWAGFAEELKKKLAKGRSYRGGLTHPSDLD